MRVFLRVYPIVFILITCFSVQIDAQDLNPSVIEAKILQGESFDYEFYSNKPILVVNEENIGGGSAAVDEVGINLYYIFTYQSAPDFVGESKFILERTSVIGSYKVYTEVRIKVVPSLIEAVKDVALLPEGSSAVTIDVLANDVAGNGTSTISAVDLVYDGSVQITNNQIVFTKAAGFEGMTSFNYTIEDASGYKSSGVVVVNVQGGNDLAGSTLEYLTSNSASVDIYLDDATYDIQTNTILNLGAISRSGDYVITYTPAPGALGQESFLLVNGANETVTVFVDIIDDGISGVLVRDDAFYTSIGTSITFDPRENDHSLDGVLLDYSDELSYDGTSFTYSPPPGYSGIKNFFYTILDGQKEMTGKIEISVGDYLPQLDTYSFETYENTPFVIEYASPILNYQWNMINGPIDGELSLNIGTYASPACSVVNGDRMVIYSPDNGFTGTDRFTIEYCVNNGSCKQVAVTINVIPSTEACPCFGGDCVWAGDADNDGKVSVKDVLAIGYNYGEIGSSRTNISDDWGANHAEDWPFQQDESDVNNKFADSNGDGIVNSLDAEVLNTNLNSYHNINAQEVLAQKDLPLTFVNRNGVLQEGLNIFDVYVGSQQIPAEDLRGVVFSIQFPVSVVDPGSIKFIPSVDWIGTGSPILTAIDLTNGLLSVGIARTADFGAFGDGRIGETRIILESLDGARPGGENLKVNIEVKSALARASHGKSFKIEGESLQLTLKLDKEQLNTDPQVLVFPNPSTDQLSFYANNYDALVDIQIYNMMGGLISEHLNIDDRVFELQHNLPQGIYTAAIKTQKGYTVEKIQVINHQ